MQKFLVPARRPMVGIVPAGIPSTVSCSVGRRNTMGESATLRSLPWRWKVDGLSDGRIMKHKTAVVRALTRGFLLILVSLSLGVFRTGVSHADENLPARLLGVHGDVRGPRAIADVCIDRELVPLRPACSIE